MVRITKTEEKDRIIKTEKKDLQQPRVLAYITILARLWTLATLCVMWATSITTLQFASGTPLYWGWYMLSASILVTLLELIWIIDKCACCTCNKEGCCCKCWSIVRWVDDWKKGILYLLVSVPLFLNGIQIILGLVSGVCLVIAGILYVVKTFKEGLIFTVTETHYIKTYSPPVDVVSCYTQTEDETFRYEDFEPSEGYKFYRERKK